jgi:uncharacterized protein YjbJ (UPF0337 family)
LQAEGQKREAAGKEENVASDAAVKAGPFTLSSTGVVAKDSHDRTAGSYNQSIGAAKEAVGGIIGNESLRQAGIQQNQQGKSQEAAGLLGDLESGLADR